VGGDSIKLLHAFLDLNGALSLALAVFACVL
jgi:hypothetical protein